MSTIGNRIFIALEVYDFSLKHAEITSALGVAPTFEQGRGIKPERIPPRREMWTFRSKDFALDDCKGIFEFCEEMDLIPKAGFDLIRRQAEVKLYIVVETTERNFEFKIPLALLKAAARLETEIDVDNYVFSKKSIRDFLRSQ